MGPNEASSIARYGDTVAKMLWLSAQGHGFDFDPCLGGRFSGGNERQKRPMSMFWHTLGIFSVGITNLELSNTVCFMAEV